ncbi:hypothetical protein FOG51_02164 [Hanseniaspora uvarum]|nr:hypothetical protein FOG48_03629 [Hanseniaspora uvarum]KAF0272872.1 hypothetical protein FOG51_02164 [Hanseniaspora uvarum]
MSTVANNSDNKSIDSKDSNVSSDFDDNKITESIPFPADDIEPNNLVTHASRLLNSEKPRSTSISIKPVKDHRRRRSSSIISHVEPETIEDETDQQLSLNANVLWIDQRGAWLVHFLIILILKVIISLLLKSNNYKHITEMSWTLTNALYCCGSYIMFHMIKGSPFDLNGGCFDNLTMWEQIDHGEQFTPARKFLILFPIGLFLISTHYSRFSLVMFIFNFFVCVCIGVIPKLPWTHRLRIRVPGISGPQTIS